MHFLFSATLTMPLSATDVHELNILLLGETGVGKSSFINSLLNYLTHESLSNAMASISDVLHLIPTQFTITTSSFDEILVAVGDGDTESENVSEVGQSATQIAQIHSFLIPGSGLKINLIDTPGKRFTNSMKCQLVPGSVKIC